MVRLPELLSHVPQCLLGQLQRSERPITAEQRRGAVSSVQTERLPSAGESHCPSVLNTDHTSHALTDPLCVCVCQDEDATSGGADSGSSPKQHNAEEEQKTQVCVCVCVCACVCVRGCVCVCEGVCV